MFKGILTVTSDINIAMRNSVNSKVLCVGEYKNVPPTFIPCSILLPPFAALNAEINDQMDVYMSIYIDHLCGPSCSDMITTILIALFNGFNITIYIDEDELSHKAVLINFITTNYGIVPIVDRDLFTATNIFNPEIFPMNAARMYCYMDGFISIRQLFDFASIPQLIDIAGIIPIDPIGKLALDLDIPPTTFENLVNILTQYYNMYHPTIDTNGKYSLIRKE